jgi:uncharacterized protein (DUF1778 family)
MARIQQRRQRSRKEQRLEARVTPEQKRLIERAATLRGTTVTEFVVALRKRRRIRQKLRSFASAG